MTFYILKRHKVIKTTSQKKWMAEIQKKRNTLFTSRFPRKHITVVTRFRGLPVTGSFQAGKLGLFETVIFGGEWDGLIRNCDTYTEAEAQHRRCLKLTKTTMKPTWLRGHRTKPKRQAPSKSARQIAQRINEAAKEVHKILRDRRHYD